MSKIQVGLIMGSQSDWSTMREAAEILSELGVKYETKIVSAHRTPDRLWEYGKSAEQRGLKVIIAGAGGAAHLPGMIASKTNLPVVGVPVMTTSLNGIDSLYSIPKFYFHLLVHTLLELIIRRISKSELSIEILIEFRNYS